jgi:hypothetical protein
LDDSDEFWGYGTSISVEEAGSSTMIGTAEYADSGKKSERRTDEEEDRAELSRIIGV